MMKWRVWDFGSCSEIVVSLGDFNGHIGKCAEVLKMCMGDSIGKEMQKEGDCLSSVMKKSCAWQTFGFRRQSKGKSLIALVDVKQKLILCLWEKNIECIKECESDFMGTSAKAGGRRSQ